VLILTGIKMLGAHHFDIPTERALAIVILVLGASIVASLLHPEKQSAE